MDKIQLQIIAVQTKNTQLNFNDILISKCNNFYTTHGHIMKAGRKRNVWSSLLWLKQVHSDPQLNDSGINVTVSYYVLIFVWLNHHYSML